jgi:hypothetical protein
MLIRVVKNWSYPDLLRQTPGGKGVWNDIRFTLEPVDECDVLLVLNQLCENITVRCPPENVWQLLQEPYLPIYLPWMREGHGQFTRVYTHCPPSANERYRTTNPLVPWHVGKSYNELVKMSLHLKDDRIVWVTSDLQTLPGHLKRYAFYHFLMKSAWPDLDVWGRGIRPISDKWDVLTQSRYAIAVENHCGDNYWTEKITDCWLADTLPFYYGCPNLESYFPTKAFVRIDLDDFDSAASIIRRMVDSGEYEKRLPAIREARDLVLNRHQFFPFMAKEVRENSCGSSPRSLQLSSYRQNPFSRLKSSFNHIIHRIDLRFFS